MFISGRMKNQFGFMLSKYFFYSLLISNAAKFAAHIQIRKTVLQFHSDRIEIKFAILDNDQTRGSERCYLNTKLCANRTATTGNKNNFIHNSDVNFFP